MKRVLSLFDYSGNWPEFFLQGGWDVVTWEKKAGRDVNSLKSVETCIDLFEYVDGVLAAIPCTDFANSGAQYWRAKDLDGRTDASMELVKQTLRIVDLFTPTDPDYNEPFFWSIENPVGRLGSLFPELPPPMYFHPYEFAGHLNLTSQDHNELDRIRCKDGVNITFDEVEFVIQCNAYTKKTGLWGLFNPDLTKRPVEPVKLCKQGSFTQRLGGNTAKTKEKRSITPLGFAKAYYEANKDFMAEQSLREVVYQMEFDF